MQNDKEEVRQRLNNSILSLASQLLPEGIMRGNNFIAGSVRGERGRSFNLCISGDRLGLWNDHATGECGDVFEFIMANQCVDFAGAMEWAKDWTGFRGEASPVHTKPPKPKPKPEPERLVPEPEDATYCYCNSQGDPIVYVDRIEQGDKKRFIQYGRSADGKGWVRSTRNTPKPYPLYMLPIIQDSDEPIVFHEGEKAVTYAMNEELDGVHTCTLGGSSNAGNSDYRPLAGRDVIICPDNDNSGEKYALTVESMAVDAGAKSVRRINLPVTGKGDDIVEFIAERNGSACDDWANLLAEKQEPQTQLDRRFMSDKDMSMPGLVDTITEYTMATSHYPNRGLAFAGAISMVASMIGQKVVDSVGTRPNIYMLALAPSASGKNAPRITNKRIAVELELHHKLADKVASREGLEDFVGATGSCLLQYDEFDALFTTAASKGDSAGRAENIVSMLLDMYSSSSSIYKKRLKANETTPEVIHNPHLNILATAIPEFLYSSMNEAMLTNGLLSRMMVIESEPISRSDIMKSRGNHYINSNFGETQLSHELVDELTFWNSMDATIAGIGFEAQVIPHTRSAGELAFRYQAEYNDKYDEAVLTGRQVEASVYGRATENMNKLALIAGCSRHMSTRKLEIDACDVECAKRMVDYLIHALLTQTEAHVATGSFDKDVKRMLRFVSESKGSQCDRSWLLRKMRCKSKDLNEMLDYAEQANYVTRTKHSSNKGRNIKEIVKRLPKGWKGE